jgi:hypothetical protein
MADPAHRPVNGDRVELHYGDVIVSLPEQLANQQKQILALTKLHERNYKLILAALALVVFHTFVPTEQLLPIVLKIIGL